MQVQKKVKMVAMSAALTGAVALIPMGASADTIDQPLDKGTHSKSVKPVQKQLKHMDYYDGQVDGIYGTNTKKAVSQYQNDHNLAKDGVYGTNTSDAMDKSEHTQKKLNNASLLQQGSRGEAVKALQTQLQRLQYYHGNIDSIFGPKTESATKALQKASNIAVDGIAGPNTKDALNNNPVSADAVNHQSSENTSNQQTKQKQTTPKKANQSSNKTTNHNQSSKTSTHKSESNNGQSQTKAASTNQNDGNSSSSASGKSVTVEATAYTANCSGCSGTTATGVNLNENPNKKVIAVDPDVIPLGSTVQVPGYGKAVAADTGGAINGNRIDIFKSDEGAANSYGRKTITVKVLD